jgi:hypothetical protein
VQSKRRASAQFLRLVDSDQESVAPKPVDNDLNLEADRLAALNGSNPYSDFLRKQGRRPDRDQAAAIGRLMGARVRASDGSMQPVLTTGERAAIRSIRKERREWAQQFDHIHRTITAITALAENHHEPSAVLTYGSDEFSKAGVRDTFEFALSWLQRFAEDLRNHDNTRPKNQKLLG